MALKIPTNSKYPREGTSKKIFVCAVLVGIKLFYDFFFTIKSQDFTYHAQIHFILFYIKIKLFANSKMKILISFYSLETLLYRGSTQSTTFRYLLLFLQYSLSKIACVENYIK